MNDDIANIISVYWGRKKPGQIFDQDIAEYEADADDIYDHPPLSVPLWRHRQVWTVLHSPTTILH